MVGWGAADLGRTGVGIAGMDIAGLSWQVFASLYSAALCTVRWGMAGLGIAVSWTEESNSPCSAAQILVFPSLDLTF